MIWRMVKGTAGKLRSRFAAYSECLGIFCIVDDGGRLLAGVRVFYRVRDGDWIPCGESFSRSEISAGGRPAVNFVQSSSVFHRIGEPVFWKFSKSGFVDKTITHGTEDPAAAKDTWQVVMVRKGSGDPGDRDPIRREQRK